MHPTPLTPILKTRLQPWLERLAHLRSKLSQVGQASWAAGLTDLEERLTQPVVIVTFGGWQKSGKSSLVNGAIGRSVLSVDDLPETGTICQIVAGTQDTAVAYKQGRSYSIDCTPQALRQVTALQPEATPRRQGQDLVDRVELTLQGTRIPRNVCWIDPPGADDTAAMTQRAQEAAAMADVLIFVNASRQPLSEAETAFLAGHVSRHGPASVILAVNAHLKAAHAEAWTEFLARTLPFYQDRIAERAAEMGFTEEMPLWIYPVSAKALASGDGVYLGGEEFMRMLLEINSPTHPRVQRTRVYRAAEQLWQLGDQIARQHEQVKAEVERHEQQARESYEQARQHYERFRRQVEEHTGWLVSSLAQDIRGVGQSVRDSVTTAWDRVSVHATVEYDSRLNGEVPTWIATRVDEFTTKILASINECYQHAITPATRDKLRTLLSSTKFNIHGGQDISEVGKGMAVAGAVAAGASSWWLHLATGGISILVATGIGAAAGAIAREKKQDEAASQARNAIRSSIETQVNAAASHVTEQRSTVVSHVLEACGRQPQTPQEDKSGRAELRALTDVAQEARDVAQEAWTMAGARGQKRDSFL